jgi:hypothetical protein
MRIHKSNTDKGILDNLDHLGEAEKAMENIRLDDGNAYFIKIALRAIIRGIEVLQQNQPNR